MMGRGLATLMPQAASPPTSSFRITRTVRITALRVARWRCWMSRVGRLRAEASLPALPKSQGKQNLRGPKQRAYAMRESRILAALPASSTAPKLRSPTVTGAPSMTENKHPTVKSTSLMAYLIRLVTPPGGKVLDPFMGSGSTGVAAVEEGMGFVGIEKDATYFKTAEGRLHGRRLQQPDRYPTPPRD